MLHTCVPACDSKMCAINAGLNILNLKLIKKRCGINKEGLMFNMLDYSIRIVRDVLLEK